MSSLQRMFKTPPGVRMSPGKSRKPNETLNSKRRALNRAAHAYRELQEARYFFAQNQAQLRKNLDNIIRLQKEYYKLARRAAMLPHANFPMHPQELAQLRRVGTMVANMSRVRRTMRRFPNIPPEIVKTIASMTHRRI